MLMTKYKEKTKLCYTMGDIFHSSPSLQQNYSDRYEHYLIINHPSKDGSGLDQYDQYDVAIL